eukprot:CAMPEP_0198246462 /NCGR_PEP_ID=MMETSP1446-20131203/45977_1 /TAXON_ID=1461542 ORGANISM="Unidentified sp, Strain CCMP2111" /NCGR_SAMPLE_ID=MMETSP1446 /ASSEMBLY_ACC=CAM_ASM_001112 /LENGTH=345 /DNA_ID=CAMNT_0043930783 /DNA_START=479 /DNA_END=1516 /DNA_ORIENTATION=+
MTQRVFALFLLAVLAASATSVLAQQTGDMPPPPSSEAAEVIAPNATANATMPEVPAPENVTEPVPANGTEPAAANETTPDMADEQLDNTGGTAGAGGASDVPSPPLAEASVNGTNATAGTEVDGAPMNLADGTEPKGICESDPQLKELMDSNPQIAQCCDQYDQILADPSATLNQGFTGLVPLLGCLQLPPIELSAVCYNDLLSSGANCFNELMIMLDFFNETGILDQAISAAQDGSVSDTSALTKALDPDNFQSEALAYLPTARKEMEKLTGSDTINPVCCQSISKLIADKCACEQTAMSFVVNRFQPAGFDLQNYVGLAKTVVGNLGCTAAEELQVYPECVSK